MERVGWADERMGNARYFIPSGARDLVHQYRKRAEQVPRFARDEVASAAGPAATQPSYAPGAPARPARARHAHPRTHPAIPAPATA